MLNLKDLKVLGMSSSEMPIEEARKQLGDLAIAAMHGQTTVLTRYGRPVAMLVPYTPKESKMTYEELRNQVYASVTANGRELAEGVDIDAVSDEIWNKYDNLNSIDDIADDEYWVIVRKHDATQTSTVTLYETNSQILVFSNGIQAWALDEVPRYLEGKFGDDAKAWIEGDWEPSENDGQIPTLVTDDLTAVAMCDSGGVTLLVEADRLGGAAEAYIGSDATQQTETVVWSVVRGESPAARAVEPGPHDIEVPDEVLAWAEQHGVGTDTDVYVLVTPQDEVGQVGGEIASMTAQATAGDVTAMREGLAERADER